MADRRPLTGDSMPSNSTTGHKPHPGFAAVQSSIASREGISQRAAGAILASSSRGASAAAKKANPNLKKVD